MKHSDTIPETRLDAAAISHEEIALRAHQLWCQQGCPQGHDLDNWLEAQRQLVSEYGSRSTAVPPSEDVRNVVRLNRGEGPLSALSNGGPLATRVEEQVLQPGKPANRQSPSSLQL